MTVMRTQSTSAGRVINSSASDIDAIFVKKFGERWLDYRKRWEEASKGEHLEDFPLFVRFENQFKCNGRCVMCVHGHADLRAEYAYEGYLALDTFRRLVDECSEHKCPSIGMSQTNEPLLDHDLLDRIRYVANKGIMDIHLNTNAMLLDENKATAILDSGVTRILFSVDAVTEKTFNSIRKGLNFQQVVANIERFLELKKKMGRELPVTRVSFLLQKSNKHELSAFQSYWGGKVDYIGVQRYVPISPFDDERAYAIEESPSGGAQRCSYPYESLFVHGDGTVVPCAAHRARRISVGNIHHKTLHEIWHSSEMNELRDAHKSGDLSRTLLCQTCLYK